MTTGLAYHRDYLLHREPQGHPERPERLTAVLRRLEEGGLMGKLRVYEPKPASEEDVLRVHARSLLEKLRSISERGGGWITGDTYVSPETYRIALLAAGGLTTAAEAILVKDVENAFALVRPPGHHAETEKAMGFCYINNPAVCARFLQEEHKLKKILIVDWDAHAANGTTEIFYSDPSVLVVSIHQDPETLYPGKGFTHETGEGAGEGFTVNIPVPPGTGDADYAYIFDEFIDDKALDFKPDFVIASAGFDSHRDDPLAELNLTEDCYAHMTGRLMEYAKKKLLVELEGGYDLKYTFN